jgi:hypothetical protein
VVGNLLLDHVLQEIVKEKLYGLAIDGIGRDEKCITFCSMKLSKITSHRRAPYREEHLRLLNEAHKRGELVMASAFSEPVDGVRVRLSRRRRRGPNAFRRARSVRP